MLLVGQSLELWRAPIEGRREWTVEVARRQLEAGAQALDLNAGVDADVRVLVDAARTIESIGPGVPLFLDGSVAALTGAIGDLHGTAHLLVANAVPLGDPGAQALLAVMARAGSGAVLSPRLADGRRHAEADQLANTLFEGAERAVIAGVSGPFFFDCLAFPPATDVPRWRRSIEIVRMLPRGAARSLVAVGNVGHGAPPQQRPWLRLIYLALALGAGAGALILPVEETRLSDATRLIEDERSPDSDLDMWLLGVARAGSKGSWELPHPPASAPPALLEAWVLCMG